MNSWTQLIEASGLTSEQADSVKKQVAAVAEKPHDPVWLKVLAAVAGWVACLFLTPFFFLFDLNDSLLALGIFGVLLLALGIVLIRSNKVLFVQHLALAFSLLGTGMMVLAFADWLHGFNSMRLLLVQALVAAIAYPLVPNAAYRFLVSVNTAFLVVCGLLDSHYAWMSAWLAFLSFATGILWIWRSRPVALNALAYACAFSLAGTVLFDLLVDQFRWWTVATVPAQWAAIPLAAVSIAVIASFTGGVESLRKPWMWGACLPAAAVGGAGETGILIALLLMVISFAWDDRLMAVFSYLFLAGFLFLYYYSLEVPLVAKSWIVGGSGLLLLVLRWVLTRLEKKGSVPP
ncbi:MAG: hypothetical protein RL693_1519 [Verrucomicrobiota bacterium]|jgi:hypothetical protein